MSKKKRRDWEPAHRDNQVLLTRLRTLNMKKTVRLIKITLLLIFVVSCGGSTPDADQIKTDLIGQHMGGIFNGWIFVSIKEFEEFKIVDKQQNGNILEYECDMRLRDIKYGGRYKAKVLIVYRKTDGTWQLVSLTQKSYKKI